MKREHTELNSQESTGQLPIKLARNTSPFKLQGIDTVNAVDSTSEENQELFLEGSMKMDNTSSNLTMANPPNEDLTPAGDGGVVKTILKVGEGSKPSNGSTVTIHYAYTIEDVVIDSRQKGRDSYKFKLGEASVIEAWNIGIASMHEGELARFHCQPQYLRGGDRIFPEIDSNQSLIFDIEMISWWNDDLSPDKDFGITKTRLKEGEESSTPKYGTIVDIHVTCKYEGTTFDDRDVIFRLGEGFRFGICKGVEVSLQHFKLNEESVLQIKSIYAFGAKGKINPEIPADAEIEFIVRLDNFQETPATCLPGISETFEEIIRNKRTYVDKTGYVAKLVGGTEKLYVLFRPRRFGKSVFLNTVEAYFSGRRDLFTGLLITKHPECKFEQYPIIRFDFCNCVCSTAEELLNFLGEEISSAARRNGVQVEGKSLVGQFSFLIQNLATAESNTHKQVVILIDECDHPLRQYRDAEQHRKIVQIMMGFYATIKKSARLIKFCLLVGITNITKDVFSCFNNVTSLNEFQSDFAGVVGFTENEIKQYLDVHLRELALELKWKPAEIYDFIEKRYNGFRFTYSPVTVYNPCSVMVYIDSKGREKNFFSQSGGSSYFEQQILENGNFAHKLFKRAVLNRLRNNASDLNMTVSAGVLYGNGPVNRDSEDGWTAMFYQIGLLTIHDVRSNLYRLKFSNLENQQFYLRVLSRTVSEKCSALTLLADKVREKILSSEMDWCNFISMIDTFLATFPCSMINCATSTESVFELIMYILLDKMGFDVDIQKPMITLVATDEDRNLVLIWELKIESNGDDALHQSENLYLQQFLHRNKDVFCMGMQFSRVTPHGLVKFGVAKYNETGKLYFRQPYECVPKKVTLQLKETSSIGDDTKILKFGWSQAAKKTHLRIPFGHHLRAVVPIHDELFAFQAYTPITCRFHDEACVVELVTKDYRNHPDSLNCDDVRQHIEQMVPGEEIDFRGPFGNLEYYNGRFVFRAKIEEPLVEVYATKLNIIAYGTGIIPMLRIIRCILTNTKDKTEIKLIFANRTPKDVLFREELDKYRTQKFKVCYTVDEPTEDWKDEKGFVSTEMITAHLHGPDKDTMILMCAPPEIVESLSYSLDELKYKPEQRFNF